MAGLSLQVAKVVGTLTKKGWSQVHTFCPEEKEKLLARGQFLVAISLQAADFQTSQDEKTVEDKLTSQGRELITRLHEEYYGELKTPALTRLKETVEKVVAESGAEITAAALVDGVCYLAILGEGKLILARKDKIVTILKGEPKTTQAVTASGWLESGDLFLLGTGEFFKLLSLQTIQMAMAGQTAQQVVEILAPVVHGQSESSLMAAVVAKTEEKAPKSAKLEPLLFSLKSRLGRLTRRAIFLRSQKKKRSRKTLLTVALFLFLLLVMSVIFGRQQRSHRVSQEKINRLFEEARFKKEEGEALIELNPARAKELLLEAQSLAQQIESEADLGKDFSRFKEELDGLLPQVLREHEIQPDLFFDLGFIKDKAVATEAVIAAEKLVVLDKEKKAIYQLGLVDQKSAILAGGEEFKTGTQLAAFWPRIFVLTEKGIIEIEKDSKKPRLVVEFDEDWGRVIDLQTFAGNLYLLTDKTIWQYSSFTKATEGQVGTESGLPVSKASFGSKKRWLKGETKIDFSEAISMAIDGSIWILQADGTIVKLTRGRKDPFGMAGLDKIFVQPQLIFTDDNCQNLYILDKGNRRVVVLEKSGEYHSQYMWEGIKDIDGLIVSEKEGKIFLLQGSKIYEIKLK